MFNGSMKEHEECELTYYGPGRESVIDNELENEEALEEILMKWDKE